MKQILFSGVGSTDPVRGEHDGPMLHILRHYRPEAVYLFFTHEMRGLANKDQRFKAIREHLKSKWDYAPEWIELDSDIKDADNLDILDEPIQQAVNQISLTHPDAELLINLSSGTPQMKLLLSQISMDLRYRARGIQVRNFENESGHTERTNSPTYEVDSECFFNADEKEDAKNRCVEPKLYAMRRNITRRQVEKLLNRRDFEAVKQMAELLPESVRNLVYHLAARNQLQSEEARKWASKITDLDYALYPYKSGDRSEYEKVCEYYLLMKNLVVAKHYTEFLLHMEPLTLTLQMAMLRKKLKEQKKRLNDFIQLQGDKSIFDPDLLNCVYKPLFEHYEECIRDRNWTMSKTEVNTYILKDLLSYFEPLPSVSANLFKHYEKLKKLRNRLAHSLCACTAQEIRESCDAKPEDILTELEGTIQICYTACDPSIFNTYDKSIQSIKKRL